MAKADTQAFPSPLSEQLPSASAKMMPAPPTEQLSLHTRPDQEQGQMKKSPSYVCDWMPTNLLLSPKDAKEGHKICVCIPVHISEASYFKQNEEKEEYKDDGYCSDTATRIRLMQLDRYLAAVGPLASSTRRLLFDVNPTTLSNDTILGHSESSLINPIKRLQNRRSKYERQYQLQMHQRGPPHHRMITATNSGRVINVLQGEIAHCTPSQADTLVSDDATTCHIVALWSRYSGSEVGEEISNNVLATMTHIDGPGYEASIRDAVNEHVKYHSTHNIDTEEREEKHAGGMIDMTIHIMGGFNDDEGSSIEVTDNVLQTFAALSNYYSIGRGCPHIRMTLETCAVASANDDGHGCPLGRGLAMEVVTGNIFLAEVEDAETSSHRALPKLPNEVVVSSNGMGAIAVDGEVQLLNARESGSNISAVGPGTTVRSVRLWASAFHSHGRKHENKLHVIYLPNRDYLHIEPFFFGPHPALHNLLGCDDQELLSLTSTSPEVEKPNFAPKVREKLSYMNGNRSSKTFPFGLPMKYRRVGLNGWALSF